MARIPVMRLLPAALFLVLAAVFFVGLQRKNPDALPSTLIGRTAPVLETSALGDFPNISDSDLRKPGVKLVNFWASWCAPCRAEHPTLIKLRDMGIPLFGVNYKDEPAKALKFLKDLGNPYAAVGADKPGRQAIEWGVYGVPETFIIDSTGKILLRFPGPITQRNLEKRILPVIASAK